MTDIADTLAERGARYGDFTDHAALAQKLQDVMRDSGATHVAGETFMSAKTGWANLSPVKRQSLTVIADKIARILSGDPEYRDNWHDIAGYAKLAEDRCVVTDGPGLPLEPMADDADGWIEWEGGEKCPAKIHGAQIAVRLRGGTVFEGHPYTRPGRDWTWRHNGGSGDIVAYKVVE